MNSVFPALIFVFSIICCTPAFADMQEDRRAFIEKLINGGIFKTVEVPARTPHVWVGPAFYYLDFDNKQQFINVIHAYYVTEGTIDRDRGLVELYDSKSGKKVGVYGAAFGGLKLYPK